MHRCTEYRYNQRLTWLTCRMNENNETTDLLKFDAIARPATKSNAVTSNRNTRRGAACTGRRMQYAWTLHSEHIVIVIKSNTHTPEAAGHKYNQNRWDNRIQMIYLLIFFSLNLIAVKRKRVDICMHITLMTTYARAFILKNINFDSNTNKFIYFNLLLSLPHASTHTHRHIHMVHYSPVILGSWEIKFNSKCWFPNKERI